MKITFEYNGITLTKKQYRFLISMWPYEDGEHVAKFSGIGEKSLDGLINYGFIERISKDYVRRTNLGKEFLDGISEKYSNLSATEWFNSYN